MTTTHTENTEKKEAQTEQQPHSKATKEFDVVLYGATSFVGKLTAKYLATFVKDKDIRVAIAGRSMDKLTALSDELNNPDVGVIIANSNEPDSLDAMTQKTKAIITTVGPYTEYGEPLVRACVKNGTDYVDLCGEMTFVREMIDKYSEQAKASGARIVNTSGFDSLPSDLGVHYLQSQAIQKFGAPCQDVSLKVKAAKGGMSGGTLASIMVVMVRANEDERIKQQVMDPYVLIDEQDKPSVTQTLNTQAKYDTANNMWQTPFIMDPTNSRIVHRSNYLSGFRYSKDFKYEELMWFPNTFKGKLTAKAIAKVLIKFEQAVKSDFLRGILTNYILPKPGTGPSVKSQENGFFDYRFYGYADQSARSNEKVQLKVKVTGQKDPGYAGTAMMLSQSALCLALDISKDSLAGGFWSPAYAMGDKLIKRLTAHAMLTFDVIE